MVLSGARRKRWKLLFIGCEVSALEAGKVLEVNGGHGFMLICMYLIPLNCTLKNGKFYVMYMLLQLKKQIFLLHFTQHN